EISFDDALQWKPVFARIAGGRPTLSADDFPAALAMLGYQMEPDQARKFWVQGCQDVLDRPAEHAAEIVNEEACRGLFLNLGLSARQCLEKLEPEKPASLFKLYWNQTRMGGRDPGDVARPVTLEDAFAALGLEADRVDRSTDAFLRQIEKKHAVRLP